MPTGTTATRPLRVLIGADTYPPDINGAARFTTRLAAGLARRGHGVHVVASSDTGAASSPVQRDGVPAVHLPRPWPGPVPRLSVRPGRRSSRPTNSTVDSDGWPVVAADAVALPHLVHPGRNGLLYRPGDVAGLAAALTALLDDPATRVRMGAVGREAAAAHDLDATLDAFEDVYAGVRRGAASVRVRRPVAGER